MPVHTHSTVNLVFCGFDSTLDEMDADRRLLGLF
jgi:hypothetical protein